MYELKVYDKQREIKQDLLAVIPELNLYNSLLLPSDLKRFKEPYLVMVEKGFSSKLNYSGQTENDQSVFLLLLGVRGNTDSDKDFDQRIIATQNEVKRIFDIAINQILPESMDGSFDDTGNGNEYTYEIEAQITIKN